MRRLAWIFWAAGIVLLPALLPAPATALQRIWIVRHAEKETTWPADRALAALQPLNAEGLARAQRWASRLANANLAAVYASPTTRCLHTGLAIADVAGCPLRSAAESVQREQLHDWFEELRERHANDQAILVVGHSNTIPWLLEALGADEDCQQRLGVRPHDWGPGIEGYDGVWRVDLDETACDRFMRLLWE